MEQKSLLDAVARDLLDRWIFVQEKYQEAKSRRNNEAKKSGNVTV